MISRIEELLLLSVHHLGDGAYGVSIREHLEELARQRFSIGSIYVPLERLSANGYLAVRESDPTPERGGRRKRLYTLTAKGTSALREVHAISDAFWDRAGDLLRKRTPKHAR